MKQNSTQGKRPPGVVMNPKQVMRGKPVAFHPSMKQKIFIPGIGLALGTNPNHPK